jgi:N6-adenosine-specific RNA methylase IME4
MVYADDVNILRGSTHNIKKSTEALVVLSKGNGREVNADKTKCTFMYRDQNARRSHKLKFYKFPFKGWIG